MTSHLGENIRTIRERRGMSVSELARRSSMSRGYLYLIEKGETNPTEEKLIAIAEALDTSVSDILGEYAIPQSLAEFARERGLTFAEVDALSKINYRGRRPGTPKEWAKLYNAIKDLLEEDE